MVWAGNEKAAVPGGYGHMRASHADREQMIGMLTTAFAQGLLTKNEFDARVGRVLTSRTYADLTAVTIGLTAARPPSKPARRQARNAVRWGTSGLFMPAILAATFALASLRGDGGFEAVGLVIAFGYFVFWLSVGADMLWQWHCASLPTARLCVRCAHTAASHRARATCAARSSSVTWWGRCPCAGYVPPGISPQAADLDRLAPTG
jgi:hypothetical protein